MGAKTEEPFLTLEQLNEKLAASGRASFELVSTIESDGKTAVTFSGKYVVHLKRD